MIIKCRVSRVSFVAFASCFLCTLVSAKDSYVELSDNSKIRLSEPLGAANRKLFEPGWGAAEFLSPHGKKIGLFPGEHFTSAGGLIFSPPEYWRISPSGRFAVLVVLRAGLIGDPQDKKVTSRQYCPVLNTSSGCLESLQSGELCAGEWDKTRDIWTVVGENDDPTSIMLGTQSRTKDATKVWDDFLKIKTPFTYSKLHERLEENLGITNLVACDPIQDKNREAYKLIADQLRAEGNSVHSIYVMEKLNASKHNVDIKKHREYS